MSENNQSQTGDIEVSYNDNDNIIIEEINQQSMSDKIDKLAGALSKAQGEIKGAESKATNTFFNSSYADLHNVIQSCLPILSKYGLSIVQGNSWCKSTNGFYVTTMLMHESGQWIRSAVRMPITKKDAQGIGATITYGRRYGLSAMVGIAQYDDDGNSIRNNK